MSDTGVDLIQKNNENHVRCNGISGYLSWPWWVLYFGTSLMFFIFPGGSLNPFKPKTENIWVGNAFVFVFCNYALYCYLCHPLPGGVDLVGTCTNVLCEGPLPKKKTVSYQDYQGLSVEITCWLPFVCATEKTHSTKNSWASCCSDAFNNNLVQRCFRKAFGICNDAVLCGVAVEYWRGIVDVDGFVLCSVEIATPLCNGMQKARRFPRMQLTLFRSPPSLCSSRSFVLLLPLLQQTPWHSWSNMASCLLFKNYLKTHTQVPHSCWTTPFSVKTKTQPAPAKH